MKNIAIIGSGSWGVALAIHLANNHNNVKLWSFNEEEKRFPVTVQTLSINEKEARVVFSATQDILSVIGLRNISFRVQSTSLEGIKIPNNAIIEKTVLKIPVSTGRCSGCWRR